MNAKLILSITMVTFLGISTASFAQNGNFAKTHPRRAQVNDRLANQNNRIHTEVKDGDMTKAKAARLHKQDHQIRQEEKSMASQNHGHITRQEQKTLDQQENRTSKKIGN